MIKQSEQIKLSKSFPRHCITWLFPILSVAYFDASFAMLCIMFVVPFIGLFFYLMDLIAKRLSYEKQFRMFISFLAIVSTCIVLYWGFHYFSPKKMFESAVASPIPDSVEIIKKGGQLSGFGSSSFYIVFNLSNADFDFILGAKEFKKKNLSNIEGRSPHLYKEALSEAEKWIEDIYEFYVKEDKNSSYRCSVLVTNRKQNKVYYRIF